MRTSIKLFAVTILGACVSVSACSSDDDSGTGTGGSAGAHAEGGISGSGGTGGSAGATVVDASTDRSVADAGVDVSAAPDSGSDTGVDAGIDAGPDSSDGAIEAAADGGIDTGVDAGPPAPPTLGAQIDRMGRPAVNTALTDPFDLVTGQTTDQVKDAYNAASDPATWATQFKGYIATNLAVLDALDSRPLVAGPPVVAAFEGCGNQFAIGMASDGGTPSAYSGLASVLADDRLYLNTSVSDAGTITCTTYLGVEANATAIIPNNDCGGRKPEYDVIDESYSVLAAGALSGISDGVAFDGKTSAAFPFLATPQ